MKISVELDEERYKRLIQLRGKVGSANTNVSMVRLALDLLFDAYDMVQQEHAVGVSRGLGQRTKQVLVEESWGDRVKVHRAELGGENRRGRQRR